MNTKENRKSKADEEKAAAEAAAEVAKTESQKIIDEMMAKMKRAHEAIKEQIAMPKVTVTQEGAHQLVIVSRAQEVEIEDEPKAEKPKFVQADEKGWTNP